MHGGERLRPRLARQAADATWLVNETVITATEYTSQRVAHRVVAVATSGAGSPRRRDIGHGDSAPGPERPNHVRSTNIKASKPTA